MSEELKAAGEREEIAQKIAAIGRELRYEYPVTSGDLFDAAKAVRKLGAWQPISTAPQDGTWVLLCGGATDEDDYRDEVGTRGLYRAVTAMWIPEHDFSEEGWAVSYWDGDWRTYYKGGTHWMPIPEFPKVSP